MLTITCSSAAWAQELDLMGPVLVERLNAALGSQMVRALRCADRSRARLAREPVRWLEISAYLQVFSGCRQRSVTGASLLYFCQPDSHAPAA